MTPTTLNNPNNPNNPNNRRVDKPKAHPPQSMNWWMRLQLIHPTPTGRIIFTLSKGIALSRNDIRDIETGTVGETFMDDTLPDGPHQRTIEYIAQPFFLDRTDDDHVACAFFENKVGSR